MSDPMKKVMKLFLTLAEEGKTKEEVRPLADRLFHNECRMEVGGDRMNKHRIMADMEEMVENKVTCELTKVEADEGGLTYEYSVRRPREKAHKMLAKAMVRDGKIYHVSISENLAASPQATTQMRRVSAPLLHGH